MMVFLGMLDLSQSTECIIVGIVLVGLFLCFLKEWLKPEIAALSAAGIMMYTGILSPKEMLTGFSNSGLVTVACMFVLSSALETTGAIDKMASLFNKTAGGRPFLALILLTLAPLILSAFVNNTPIVVILMPIVLAFCRQHQLTPSKYLIPLSYATILGGTCTVIGTSTNILVQGIVRDKGYEGIKMFTLAPMGILYSACGLIFIWTIGRKLLPSRQTLSTLLPTGPQRDFLIEAEMSQASPLLGKSAAEVIGNELRGMRLLEVRRNGVTMGKELDKIILGVDDTLILVSSMNRISKARQQGLLGVKDDRGADIALEKKDSSQEVEMIEAILGMQSPMIGRTLAALTLRQKYRVLVLAIHRSGQNISERISTTKLQFGDTLLLEGSRESMDRLLDDKLVISLSRMRVQKFRTNKIPYAILAMVLFIGLGMLDIPGLNTFSLSFFGAMLVILAGCVRPREAYQAVDWSILLLIFGMLGVGRAMEKSGLAQMIADSVVGVAEPYGPWIVLSVIYLLCSILTELVSNNAVAVILTPIVFSIAQGFGMDPLPFLMAVMFGASASFATPVGYQTNTYVYNAGGYKFSDFVKIGLPLNILLWIVFSLCAPYIFG